MGKSGPRASRKEIAHGTDAGYHLHRRWHQKACPDCLAAHNAASRARQAGCPPDGRKRNGPALTEIEHGTDSGYMKHYRRKEEPCPPCKAAHNEYAKRKKAERDQAAGIVSVPQPTVARLDLPAALFADIYFTLAPELAERVDAAVGRRKVDKLITIADEENNAA